MITHCPICFSNSFIILMGVVSIGPIGSGALHGNLFHEFFDGLQLFQIPQGVDSSFDLALG
jgi:hypothetical protein